MAGGGAATPPGAAVGAGRPCSCPSPADGGSSGAEDDPPTASCLSSGSPLCGALGAVRDFRESVKQFSN